MQPKIKIESDKKGSYQLAPGRNIVKDLAGNAPPAEAAGERLLIEKAIERYRSAIEALQTENEILRREREILKKAVSIFSQHLP